MSDPNQASKRLRQCRDATEPDRAAYDRVRRQLRRTLATDPATQALLRAAPEPAEGALARVKAHLRASLRGGARPTPFSLAAYATAVAAIAVVVVSRTPEPPSSTVASGALAEERAPEPVVPVEGERRDAVPSPPRESTAVAKAARPPPIVVSALQVFGQADRAGAEAALAKLNDALAPCLGAASDELRVSIVVDADGTATAMSADGPSPAKERFASCAQPVLVGVKLGAATTLRAGAQEQITGGVVRFRIQRGVP